MFIQTLVVVQRRCGLWFGVAVAVVVVLWELAMIVVAA
jgi:hypothetical protein